MVGKKSEGKVPVGYQHALDLTSAVEREVGGIEMGVLDNGMPYLTQAGLAALAGVSDRVIRSITTDYAAAHGSEIIGTDRISKIRTTLLEQGFDEAELALTVKKGGQTQRAYPELVCIAILEYYALDADDPKQPAKDSYRRFARYGLDKFIYDALGYRRISDRDMYDARAMRSASSDIPEGHWIVFHEIVSLQLELMGGGFPVNEHTMPDLSVSGTWGRHWADCGGDNVFGARVQVPYYYPEVFPQHRANPHLVWCYPDEALPEFRRWLREVYLPIKFPPYLRKKASILTGGLDEADAIAARLNPKAIT